jgi:hypothetical protein
MYSPILLLFLLEDIMLFQETKSMPIEFVKEQEEKYRRIAARLPKCVEKRDVPNLTGGIVPSTRILTSHDKKGTGPERPFYTGNSVLYEKQEFLWWLQDYMDERIQKIDKVNLRREQKLAKNQNPK